MIVLVVPEYVLGYTQSVYVYTTWVPNLIVLVTWVPNLFVLVAWVPNLVVLVAWVPNLIVLAIPEYVPGYRQNVSICQVCSTERPLEHAHFFSDAVVLDVLEGRLEYAITV